MSAVSNAMALIAGDRQADRVVPPTGFTAKLTIFAAAAMGFLAVFALALMLATGRIADSWSDALAQSATVRVSAPDGQVETQVAAVMAVLRTTPGIAEAQVLSDDDQRALLEPWFGPDLPLDALPVPKLIAITETPEGYDSAGLRARLAGEAPGGQAPSPVGGQRQSPVFSVRPMSSWQVLGQSEWAISTRARCLASSKLA